MHGLSPGQIADYWRNGYLHLPGVFPSEQISELAAECDRLLTLESVQRSTRTDSFRRKNADGETIVNRIDPVIAHSPLVATIAKSKRICDPIRALFDDDPLLFKDKLIYRPPGSIGYGVHQDYAYYGWTGVPANELIAAQIAIDDASEENGAVHFCPAARDSLLPAKERRGNDIASEYFAETEDILIDTCAGDVLLFHPLVPHYSHTNNSPSPRRTLYLTYSAARAGDFYRIYYQDRGVIL